MSLITFSAGQRVTASQLMTMVNQIDSLTAPGWVSYGTWSTLVTAVTTNPTQGSSSAVARYRRPAGSDICDYQIKVLFNTGGGFNAGSGAYRFLLPFTASTSEIGAHHMTIMESGVLYRSGGTDYVDQTHVEGWYAASGAPIGYQGLSTSWTTGDYLKIAGSFQVQ